jgi:hypothetical protein
MTDKIPVKEILNRIDKNDDQWFMSLTPEQQKQANFWLLNRYVSSSNGTITDKSMAVLLTNEFYNKNWNVLSTKHPLLQWQILCMINSSGKSRFHKYINLKRTAGTDSKSIKLLLKLYPNKKLDEVELLARISSKKDLRELAEAHGLTEKDIDI